MFDINILLRLTRMREFLPKLILILPLIFLISPQNIFTYKTILIFCANLFLTAFIYAINDVEDAEDDYHDIKKRKRNPLASTELTKKQGYLFSFSVLFIGLLLLLTISRLVFLIGFILTLIGFLYSLKPIRLKSIPINSYIKLEKAQFKSQKKFMNIHKSIRFVKIYGNSIEKARLLSILRDEEPSEEVLQKLKLFQTRHRRTWHL